MSNHILRDLTTSVQSSPFITIMINEATDKSNTEQATVVLRWVSDSLKVNEDYVGLYEVPSIDADTLTSAIQDVLLRMNLSRCTCNEWGKVRQEWHNRSRKSQEPYTHTVTAIHSIWQPVMQSKPQNRCQMHWTLHMKLSS